MDHKNHKKNRKPVLFRFTNRIVLFLFFLLILVFVFYIAGNFQNFHDENVKILLHLLSFCAVSLLWFLICGFIEIIVFLFIYHDLKLLLFIPVYVFFALCAILSGGLGTLISYLAH